jgi:hypothetical protein
MYAAKLHAKSYRLGLWIKLDFKSFPRTKSKAKKALHMSLFLAIPASQEVQKRLCLQRNQLD